jgi:hypothetical protein
MMEYTTLSDVFCHPRPILHRIQCIFHPPTGGYLTPKLSISKYGEMYCTQLITYIVGNRKEIQNELAQQEGKGRDHQATGHEV